MFQYSQTQWILFFFIYCLFGWIWESCYVSFNKKHWTNRGFLNGPLLPIYGSGAIIILFLTLPVRHNIVLIFLLGMIGATVLEYVTGAIMERMFHVRYWDYSNDFCNLNGHICLVSSLAWGGFSILLVKVVHRPVEQLILEIPTAVSEPVSLILVMLFMIDVTRSVQAAFDVRKLLENLEQNSETIAKLKNALEVLENTAVGVQLRQGVSNLDEIRQEKLKALRQLEEARKEKVQSLLHDTRYLLKRNPDSVSRHHAKELLELMQHRK